MILGDTQAGSDLPGEARSRNSEGELLSTCLELGNNFDEESGHVNCCSALQPFLKQHRRVLLSPSMATKVSTLTFKTPGALTKMKDIEHIELMTAFTSGIDGVGLRTYQIPGFGRHVSTSPVYTAVPPMVNYCYPRESKHSRTAVWPLQGSFTKPDKTYAFIVTAAIANLAK